MTQDSMINPSAPEHDALPDFETIAGVPAFHPALSEIGEKMSGIPFPTTRGQLVEFSREKNVPPAIIARFEKLPDITFTSIEDIIHALGAADNPHPDITV
jgi:hypothetical protein